MILNARGWSGIAKVLVRRSSAVKTEWVGSAVRRITLDLPTKRNALSLGLMTALEDALRAMEMSEDGVTKAIIIKSSSTTFSSGHDLTELSSGDHARRKAVFDKAAQLMTSLEHFFVPVIVSIHGTAAAAGCQLVASCDIAVCSDKSKFSTPGILAGLFCSTPGVAIGRSIPRKIALEMLLTGEPISAERALRYGLVNYVVPEAEVDLLSEKIAEKIANLSSPVIKLGKQTFIKQMRLSKDDAYELASKVMLENLGHPDCVEGVNAFIQKRKPIWNVKK